MSQRRDPFFIRAAGLALLCATATTPAAVQNRHEMLNVRADAVTIDEKTGTAVYRGRVLLTQGSLRVEADRLEVRTDKNRRLNSVTAIGRPAKLRGFVENRDDEIQAEAERVIYRASGREIEMTGNAWARQGKDEFRAQQINYGIDSKQLTAQGGGGADGRVHVIFQPKYENEKTE
jgi:lipopolysaccharide export system protein LptA